MIAVPTPLSGNKKPVIDYVISRRRKSIAPRLKRGNLVIIELTCPSARPSRCATCWPSLRPDLHFPGHDGNGRARRLSSPIVPSAFCRAHPERARAERPLRRRTDRRIAPPRRASSTSCSCAATASRPTARTAEMVKLTENAFRDTNIAFANELSLICDRVGVNVWEVIELANRHPRVNILKPGPGVGGHCIAVDPWFIVDAAPQRSARSIRMAREVNDGKADLRLERQIDRLMQSYPDRGVVLPWPRLQGQCRRSARKPGARNRAAALGPLARQGRRHRPA